MAEKLAYTHTDPAPGRLPLNDANQSPDSDQITENEDQVRTWEFNTSAEGDVIPLAYGLCDLDGKVSVIAKINEEVYAAVYVWCVGPIQSILQFRLNDSIELPEGTTVKHYLGTTTQPPDPTLKNRLTGYNDSYVHIDSLRRRTGIAYSVVLFPVDAFQGLPKATARVQGRLVPTTSGTRVYSDLAVTVLADLVVDPVIGLGRKLNMASYQTAINYNQKLSGSGLARNIRLKFASPQSIEKLIETARAYADVTIAYAGNEVFFIPNLEDAPATVALGPGDIIKNSLRIGYREQGTPPTTVLVTYSDYSTYPATRSEALVPADAPPAGVDREKRIAMPGLATHGQAYRVGKEYLARLYKAPLVVTWEMADEGVTFLVGDRVDLTYLPYQFNPVKLRVVETECLRPGRWRLRAEQFQSTGIEWTQNVSAPTTGTGSGGEYVIPPPPEDNVTELVITGLTLTQEDILDNRDPAQARIIVSWDPLDNKILQEYEVQAQVSGSPSWPYQYRVTGTTYQSEPTNVGYTYNVRVRARFTDGRTTAWALASIYLAKPSASLGPTTGLRATGGINCFSTDARPFSIEVAWGYPLGASNIKACHVYYHTINSYGAASLLATVAYPGRSYTLTGLATGQRYYFWTRLEDMAGNLGNWSSINGVAGSASCSADKVLGYISGLIEQTDLHNSLSSLIDSKLDDDSPPIIAIEEDIEGLSAQYTVKIQQGQYVAGFGLSVDAPDETGVRSNFIVRADRFAVGHPTEQPNGPEYPFIIQNGHTYIAKAAIGEAWIETANIAKWGIVPDKIAPNSTSETYPARSYAVTDASSGTWYTVYNKNFNFSNTYAAVYIGQALFEAQGTDYSGDANPTMGLRVILDGVVVKEIRYSMPQSYARPVLSGGGLSYVSAKHAGSVEAITVGNWSLGSRGVSNLKVQARIFTNYDRSTSKRYIGPLDSVVMLMKR